MLNVDSSLLYEDKLIVRGLNARSVVGGDHWARPKLQPIIMNIVFYTNIEVCGETDLLTHSLSYSDLASKATEIAENETHSSVFELATKICSHLLHVFKGIKVTVSVQKPKGLLHADSSGIEITRTREIVSCPSKEEYSDIKFHTMEFCKDDKVFIDGLRLNSIIGIHPWEREAKQVVLLYLTLYPGESNTKKPSQSSPEETQLLVTKLSQMVETSRFKTVEALATSVSRLVLFSCNYPKVTVRVEKPSALRFAAGAATEITRDISYFSQDNDQPPKKMLKTSKNGKNNSENIAYIALGSNLENRYDNITKALTFLKVENCKVLDTSFLYETAPMYVSDQPKFLNGVCKISTTLEPIALLDLLKKIEEEIGRVPTFRNGPRLVDLDILDYSGLTFASERLELPHPRICEREFVLRPLCDIDPAWVHPILRCTSQHLLQSLEKTLVDNDVVKALPLPGGIIIPLGIQTYIMGILNVTPDSFSDGGKYNELESAVERAKLLLSGGADIIDIGGASSRPGAEEIPVSEELARILPVIRQLRSEGISCPISVDTFHAEVAEEALLAGASLINDISGGTRDPNMFNVISRLDVPICLMHMRGNSSTMNELTQYTKGQVMETVQTELESSFRSAANCGIYRWNLIADPGIGFSKDCQQNLEILRNLKAMTKSFPCLIGTSRKKFLGALTGKSDPEQRTWATAATCTAAIAAGVDFLRVHDVSELKDVVKVSDAIYRQKSTI